MLCGQFCDITFKEILESLHLTGTVEKTCTTRAFENDCIETTPDK